jgi:hypothetical protein
LLTTRTERVAAGVTSATGEGVAVSVGAALRLCCGGFEWAGLLGAALVTDPAVTVGASELPHAVTPNDIVVTAVNHRRHVPVLVAISLLPVAPVDPGCR